MSANVNVPSGIPRRGVRSPRHAREIVPNIVDVTLPSARRCMAEALHVVVARNLEPIYDNATALRAFAVMRSRCPMRA